MKALRRTILPVMVFVIFIVMGTAVRTYAIEIKQSQIYSDKIVIDIAPTSGETVVSSIDVLLRTNLGDFQQVQTLDSTATQVTIGGLDPHNLYDVRFKYTYKTGSFLWEETKTNFDSLMAPVKVRNLVQERWWYYIKKIDAKWDKQQSVSGYQYEFYNWKNKIQKTETRDNSYLDSYAELSNIKNGKSYKMRVRAYTDFNGTRIWGDWSDWTYFVGQTPKIKPSFKNKKLTIKWSKVSGATSYTIMVSTKSDRGYKALKTVSAKKTKVSLKKFGKKKFKKGKWYYVYVRSNKKVGGKTFTSNNGNLPLYYSMVKCK